MDCPSENGLHPRSKNTLTGHNSKKERPKNPGTDKSCPHVIGSNSSIPIGHLGSDFDPTNINTRNSGMDSPLHFNICLATPGPDPIPQSTNQHIDTKKTHRPPPVGAPVPRVIGRSLSPPDTENLNEAINIIPRKLVDDVKVGANVRHSPPHKEGIRTCRPLPCHDSLLDEGRSLLFRTEPGDRMCPSHNNHDPHEGNKAYREYPHAGTPCRN